MKRLLHILTASAILPLLAGSTAAQTAVSFETDVLPILESRCLKCHCGVDAKGKKRRPKAGLRLDGKGWILRGSSDNVVLVPGDSDASLFYTLTVLSSDDEDRMPGRGKPLTEEQTETLRRWIAAGADFGSWVGRGGPASDDSTAAAAMVPTTVKLAGDLARGVTALPASTIAKAAGDVARIEPVQPGSPMLRVAFLSHEQQVEDAQVAALVPLTKNITHLSLARTKVTDRALRTVARMSKLTSLDVSDTAITDQGLRHLRALGELRSLNLHSTGVTDAGVAGVAKLTKLNAVYLWNTGVTDAGANALREQLPDALVHRSLTLPEVPPVADTPRGRRGGGKKK